MASRYCERSSNSAHSSSEVHSRILQFSCVTSSSKRSLPSSAVNLSLYSILPTVGSGGKENDGAVGTVCKTLDIWWAGIREELLLCDQLAPTKQLPSWSSAIPMRARHTWHSCFLRGTLRLKSILLMVCKGTGSPTGLGNTPQAHKCNKWGSVTSPSEKHCKSRISNKKSQCIKGYQRAQYWLPISFAQEHRPRKHPVLTNDGSFPLALRLQPELKLKRLRKFSTFESSIDRFHCFCQGYGSFLVFHPPFCC